PLALAAGVAEEGDPGVLAPREGDGAELLVVLDLHVFFFLAGGRALASRGMPAEARQAGQRARVDGRVDETAAAPPRPVRAHVAVRALPERVRQQPGRRGLVRRHPGTAGRAEDGREPGADGEVLAAVQPRTLAEGQRRQAVGGVDDAEPLTGPACLASCPLLQVEDGDLA